MPPLDQHTLNTWLATYWDLPAAPCRPLEHGHTNTSYAVALPQAPAVLRLSWPGKPAAVIEHEARLLAHLQHQPRLPAVPHLRPSRDGHHGVPLPQGRWLHLFDAIPGQPGLPTPTPAAAAQAMQALGQLHLALARLPARMSSPVAWLRARQARVAAQPLRGLPAHLHTDVPALHAAIESTLALTESRWAGAPSQWLHGDYHAGNLLFVGQRLRGIVDFDSISQGAPWLEAACALFALSRNVACEHTLAWDDTVWQTGLQAYADTQPDTPTAQLHEQRALLRQLFCVDQVLIHLEAAQHQLWTLGPGIGFLGCWHTLRNATVTPA